MTKRQRFKAARIALYTMVGWMIGWTAALLCVGLLAS
jgi:hypothetical protein